MSQEQNMPVENKESIFQKPWIQSVTAIVVIFGALGGFLFWQSKAGRVLIENSHLEAPLVNLSPVTPGTLQSLYVHEGDTIAPNTQVALVGTGIISSKTGGIVASAKDVVGQYFAPGQTVVSIVDTANMEVVGSVEETKGLSDLAPGQRATFTVDTFGGTKYQGVVDTISPSSEDTGVAFSISDKRPIKKFTVKVRFNSENYPELRNGMSARITVYTK